MNRAMFLDAEPEQASEGTVDKQPEAPPKSEETSVDFNHLKKVERLLKKYQDNEVAQTQAAAKAEREEKEQELVRQNRFEEIQKAHSKDLEDIKAGYESLLRTEQLKTQLGQHFHPAFFEHALSKLDGVEDTDAAIAELSANEEYAAFKTNAPTQTQRTAAGLPAAAGSRTAASTDDDLYTRIKSDDMKVRSIALDEELEKRLKGDLPVDWRFRKGK